MKGAYEIEIPVRQKLNPISWIHLQRKFIQDKRVIGGDAN